MTHSDLNLASTTYARVHQAIIADIVAGVFAPGARLKIIDLCRRYGLSAMPVREALQQLQGEGVVVVSPNRGASVRLLDAKFVSNIYELRAALATVIYSDALTGMRDDDLAKLDVIQQGFDRALDAGDTKGCNSANYDFHSLIWGFCGNDEVLRAFDRHSPFVKALRSAVGYTESRLADIAREHWSIIAALKARDRTALLAAGQLHTLKACDDMLRRVRAFAANEIPDAASGSRG